MTKDQLVRYLRVCADLADSPKDGIAHVAIVPLRQVIQLLESSAEPETERCESLSPDHGTWRCEKPTGHQGPHEVHGDTAYVSWAPDKSFVQKAKAYGPGMTPHADDCECYVCGPKRFCPHCGKSEPHTHRVPGVAEPVVFPHS